MPGYLILLKESISSGSFGWLITEHSAELFQLLSVPKTMKSVITYCHLTRSAYDKNVGAAFCEIASK
ncbi:MAG: hypothetical protein DRR15_11665 [Gammaproteobacteria bacterium]|nr:MAG: hypothetical protein DRR15_11665 [Gammaproteobacteria bacterium]